MKRAGSERGFWARWCKIDRIPAGGIPSFSLCNIWCSFMSIYLPREGRSVGIHHRGPKKKEGTCPGYSVLIIHTTLDSTSSVVQPCSTQGFPAASCPSRMGRGKGC